MDRIAEEPPVMPAKGPAWLAAEAYGIDMSLVEDALRKRFGSDALISFLRKPYGHADIEQAVANARNARGA